MFGSWRKESTNKEEIQQQKKARRTSHFRSKSKSGLHISLVQLGDLDRVDLYEVAQLLNVNSKVIQATVGNPVHHMALPQINNFYYGDEQILRYLPMLEDEIITIGVVDAPIQGNYYSRVLADNAVVISLYQVYELCQRAGMEIAGYIAQGVITNLLEILYGRYGRNKPIEELYHNETRGCLFDFCQHKPDKIHKIKHSRLCLVCSNKLAMANIQPSILVVFEDILERIRKQIPSNPPEIAHGFTTKKEPRSYRNRQAQTKNIAVGPAFHQVLAQATCAVVIDEEIIGTAWLVSHEGHLLTAGHVLGTDSPLKSVKIKFSGDFIRQAHRIEWGYQQERAIDFAILKLESPLSDRQPLPISLTQSISGRCTMFGYGKTLGGLSQGEGNFVGSYYRQNSMANHLFRLRSSELSEEGYSGGALFSEELQAVVAIQIETTRARIGPGYDTVLAMPLYRIAHYWPSLRENKLS